MWRVYARIVTPNGRISSSEMKYVVASNMKEAVRKVASRNGLWRLQNIELVEKVGTAVE